MNGFAVWKQDHAEKPTLLFDFFPLSDPLMQLNLYKVRILNRLFNPFRLYFLSLFYVRCHIIANREGLSTNRL
jgi:hypothetical protein